MPKDCERCLNDNFRLRKLIFTKNPGAHFTLIEDFSQSDLEPMLSGVPV